MSLVSRNFVLVTVGKVALYAITFSYHNICDKIYLFYSEKFTLLLKRYCANVFFRYSFGKNVFDFSSLVRIKKGMHGEKRRYSSV